MWTTLKNWYNGYKFVKLSNGKWLCFVKEEGLWQALSSPYPSGPRKFWRTPKYITEYCQFTNELSARQALEKHWTPSPSIHDEIKANQ